MLDFCVCALSCGLPFLEHMASRMQANTCCTRGALLLHSYITMLAQISSSGLPSFYIFVALFRCYLCSFSAQASAQGRVAQSEAARGAAGCCCSGYGNCGAIGQLYLACDGGYDVVPAVLPVTCVPPQRTSVEGRT